MEKSELAWHAMEEGLWPSEQEVENVKNEKEEFVERCDEPMLINEAEDLIKEGEQLKERMNKVKATYENYLKVLEEYHSGFERWKKNIRHLSLNGMRLHQNLLKSVMFPKEKTKKVKRQKKKIKSNEFVMIKKFFFVFLYHNNLIFFFFF